MSIDAAIAIAWDVFKSVVAPIKRQFGYVICSKRHAQDLQNEVKKLAHEVDRVHNLAEEARNNLRNVYDHVTESHASAEKALKEAQDLLGDIPEASKTCCYGTLPDPKCRYQFSRKAKDKIEVIQQLTQECREFRELNDISSSNPAPGNVAALIPAKDNGVFESRASIIRDIMDALADDSNSVVGVYGQGGVGKSTLLADVERRIIEKKSFDWVTKADVSDNPDIKEIQGEIAHALGLDLKNEGIVRVRAGLLHERLENEEREKKKVLIILDNLWKGLDLKSVGIPCGHDNKVIGCKLLLTSRLQDVLRREMVCDRDFHLDELKEEEAKRLFERMVGDKVHDDPFKSLVDEALRKCAGLPFLIIAMAKIFKDANHRQWMDALKQIEMSTNKGLSETINKMLQLSYDSIEGEAKSLLRLCVVYGVSKPSLEILVRYAVGLRLFEEIDKIEDARNRLSTLIHNLQASSLLLDNEDDDGFKIHDLVHGFVASIASREEPLLVWKDNDKSVMELPKDKLKSCTALCFSYVEMEQLPEELDCPETRIFLLFTNNDSLKVPDSYFNSMRKLMVLHLSQVCLTRSPSPFKLLEDLHTLCLDGCSLEDVAMIGELKGLHILSFVNSNINRLPKEIGQLVELRLLDLSECSQLEIIEPGVLGSLMKLEELYMLNSFDKWNAMEQTPPTNAELIELGNRKNLHTLHVSIPDLRMLPKDLNVKKLTKYNIQIGGARCYQRYKGSSVLELKLHSISDSLKKGCIQTLLGKTDHLLLDGLNGIESICSLSHEGFQKLKHLYVKYSPSTSNNQVDSQVAFFDDRQEVTFPSLETLDISGMDNIEIIWDNQVAADSFHKLKSLEVWRCNKLLNIVPSYILGRLKSLESLKVRSCDLLEVVFKLKPLNPLDGHPIAHLPLKRLELDRLPELKCVWDKELHSQVKFQCLRFVTVYGCKSLTSLFPASVVVHLTQLEELEIDECGIVELIEKEDRGVPRFVFPKLTSLKLKRLTELRCIYIGKYVSHWPALKTLDMNQCHKVEILASHPENDMPFDKQPLFLVEKVSIPSLESLTMAGLPNLEELWTDESPLALSNLKFLVLSLCKSLSKVINSRSLIKLQKLHTLMVRDCISVQEIFDLDGVGVNVETLSELNAIFISGLPSLRCVWNKNPCGIVRFHNLKKLQVHDCENLRFLFFPSMVQSLAQLRKLKVWSCKNMEAIIMEEEGLRVETLETLVFPMLTELNLEMLESLTCFSHRKCTPKAQGEDNVKLHSPILFNQEVAFPNLETLYIDGMNNIEILWDNQVAVESFHKLKLLSIDRCNKLVNIVPSCILGRFRSLESMNVRSCGSLEVIFKLQLLNPLDGHPVAPFPLKALKLYGLSKLKCVWDKELHSQVKFQYLCSITVSKCKNLMSLFPTSVVVHLTQLEELMINECGIVELIEKEDGLVPKFVFPKLASFKLEHLTELKCIYIGKHASHWPALKTLEVRGCDKVEIFASHPENEMPLDKQPLFLIEKGEFSKLQKLKLESSKWMEIWHGNFLNEELFHKLRVLELCRISKEFAMSASHFVQSLPNLEELLVCKLYLEELSINVEAVRGQSHELKVVLPFLRYSQHLKTLDVSYCDVSNMFTSTIVGNLVELTKLRISNCHMLIEVITEVGDKERHVVAFQKLRCMELDGLIGLRCFSSGGYTLMFPLLENVTITRCPNMKFFSEGPIEAPKLGRVQVSKVEWFWKGNLNTTIQSMFEQMGIIAGVKFMRLSEFSKLMEKWHNKLIPINSYWHLKYLVVYKCPSFVNAIPSRLMLVLGKMKGLQVCDCESLEEIFSLEGMEAMKSSQVLPQLNFLDLVNLPKLRRLWNKNLQGELHFNSLTYLGLYNCSNLRHAFAPSMAQCLANLEEMVIKECGQMEGVIAEEEGQGSVVEKITFMNLSEIELECLPHFTSFLLGKNYMLYCPRLRKLTIAHCSKMRSFTQQSLMEIDHDIPSLFNPQVQFPKLEIMVLSHLDDISKIWTDSPQETLTFDCLQKVEAKNCKSLENLFPHWLARSLSQIKELRIESCELKEIVARADPPSNIAQFLFPKLTSLVLHDMPRVKNFCPNLRTLNWPFLNELRVTHCDKLNKFSVTASMNKWVQRDDQHDLSDHEAHLPLERDIPIIERLLLFYKDIRMILDGKFPDDIFGKPKALTLACFHDKKAVFPPRFLLERFQSLRSLEVFCSSFEDIFPNEGLVDEGLYPVLENLSELKLSKLHNIKRVWREDYLVAKILQSIKTFEVQDCPSLTTIFPAMASFQNLTKLVVKNSSGLVHLVTFSTITNLVHLTEMTIKGCERMKEIVANDGKGEGEVISLEKLKTLELQYMPSLLSFSSIESCIFRFPLLDDIKVEECPRMKIFSRGIVSTPELHYVMLFRHIWDVRLEGDLNTAMQKLSA